LHLRNSGAKLNIKQLGTTFIGNPYNKDAAQLTTIKHS